jgi:isopenicillin N synthase-like dioxygenase
VSVPVLRADRLAPGDLERALREHGGALLSPSVDPDLCEGALQAARAFFALPTTEKASAAIERSRHFRGWSEMHNERDWREQIHLGQERPAAGEEPPYLRLEGPNLWPPGAPGREAITAYLEAAADLGETLLAHLARELGVPGAPFDGTARDGYILMKLIGYHPQVRGHGHRPGVAAHVDFSWLTLTLQDAPGLEVRGPDGAWVQVEPLPGGLWVHPGELLQFATGGLYQATPHRVINPSLARTRVSIPLFVNPPLGARVEVLRPGVAAAAPEEHVHRVLPPGAATDSFLFGPAEWQRKGLNGWCHACAPARSES